jgi:hypothetical protein
MRGLYMDMRPVRPSASLSAAVIASFVAACANSPDPGGGQGAWLLEGRLETIVVEGPRGATKHFLFPDDGSDPVELDFGVDPTSGSGSRIGVDGYFEGARFRVVAFDDTRVPEGANTLRQSALAAVTPERTRTVAFVMVDYGMGVNQTRTAAERFMFSTTNPGPTLGIGTNDKSVLQFYDETSYGLFNISGAIEGPLSWTGGAACNGSGGSQLASMLRGMLSTTYGHNIWYYGSRQSACEYGWGSLGRWSTPSSNVWFNGALFDGAITHEIGHNLGYQHASSIKCSGTPLANDPLTCTTTEYGSAISIMGNTSNGHMMALEKWYAGWFKGCNAVRVRSSGTFNLLPIESPCGGGVQALQIPMPVTDRRFDPAQTSTAPIRFYYLEYRNGTALDTGIAAAVYVVASDEIAAPNQVCARSVQLDMNPSTNPLNGMTAGQSFTDPAGGVTFSVMSLTPAGAIVNVTIDGASAANTCMDGSPLAGSGPTVCSAGPGGSTGSGGTGGGGGVSGRGGTTGAGGAAGAGAGGAAGAGRGGAGGGGAGGAAGRGGTTGAGGTTGGAAGTMGTGTGTAGRGGTTGTGGQSGTVGTGAGGGPAAGTGGGSPTAGTGGGGPVVTAGTTGSTGVGGSTSGGAGTSGSGSGVAGVSGGSVDAGTQGPGLTTGGCSCGLGGSPDSGGRGPAIVFALTVLGLAWRRPRAR